VKDGIVTFVVVRRGMDVRPSRNETRHCYKDERKTLTATYFFNDWLLPRVWPGDVSRKNYALNPEIVNCRWAERLKPKAESLKPKAGL
jgi:hypothetical protein